MTALQRQVKSARRQLTVNHLLLLLGRALSAGAVTFGLVVIIDRIFNTALPLTWLAGGIAAAAIAVAIVWAIATRVTPTTAATALDEAAGLRERISTGIYCTGSDDPFERAVVADAERVGTALTVRQHLPLRWPMSLNLAGACVAAALLTLLLPQWNVLADSHREDEEKAQLTKQIEVTQATWERKQTELKETVEANPLLKDEADKLDEMKTGRLESMNDVQRETLKRIESLRESVEEKREENKYGAMDELKKMLNRLPREDAADKTPVNKLSEAMSKGDFTEAKKALEEIQEKLAKAKTPEEQQLSKEMQDKLADLAKKIDQAAQQDSLEKELEAQGLNKKDVERLMANLEKKDLDAIKKALEEKGMSQQQAQQMAKKMAQSKMAQEMAKKLANSLGQSASDPGSEGQGQQQGGGMGDLSDLEALEMEMAQMDATMSELDDMANDTRNGCSQCNGTGQQNGKPCGSCNGTGMGDKPGNGGGMGQNMGKGQGNMAPEEQTALGWKREKAKLKTTKGRIIGKRLVPGEQLKGDATSEYQDIVVTGEREASEALEQERIPQQYRKTVKEWFNRDGE